MDTTLNTDFSDLNFTYLPGFARYLVDYKLNEYVHIQLQYSRELQMPLLKLMEGFSTDQLIAQTTASSIEFLHYLADNNAAAQILDSQQKWLTNQLPSIKSNEVTAEDITGFTYLRKKTFTHFLAGYCKDAVQVLNLVSEIDLYLLKAQNVYTQTYMNLLNSRIEEQADRIQRITNAAPGMIYLYDLTNNRIIFTNERVKEYIGAENTALLLTERNALAGFIHPDDLPGALAALKSISDTNGKVKAFECRLKSRSGTYLWMRSYISVFKRNENGEPVEIIGNVLNINTEKIIAEQLKQREEQLVEAQEVAGMGSYDWNLTTRQGVLSAQLKQIFESPSFNSLEQFFSKVHPGDRAALKNSFYNAVHTTNFYEIQYKYLGQNGYKTLWSRGKVTHENGAVKITGIVMDITERSSFLEKLQQSEERYKQAQALSHIGHYTLDLKTNEIELTEELNKIYDFEAPYTTISYDEIINLRHPDDRDSVQKKMLESINTNTPFNFYYRIITKKGNTKILHAIGKLILDESGEATHLVGTIQDVTVFQTLMQKLQLNEFMYKQAEVLANMGNWNWNVHDVKLEWSDQLYKIYGLEPQSEEITIKKFISFIHPDDREFIENSINNPDKEDYIDYTFRVVTREGAEKTLRSIAQTQRDKEGRLINILGSEQDITEHQRLIKQLQASENLYKQAQAIAHLGNWTYNYTTQVTTWSDELYNIYELPKGEPASFEQFINLIHPEDKESVLKHYEEAIAKKLPYDKRHRIVLQNGKIKTLYRKGQFKFDANGNVIETFGTTQDITEQMSFEKQLSEHQNFIQKIADATPSIISAYNIHSGQYVFVNQGITKLLGYTTQQVLDGGIEFLAGLVHPDDIEQLIKENNNALEEYNKPENQNAKDVIIEFKYRIKHKNGDWRWLHTYGTIFDRNSKGQIEHVLNISLDMTEALATEKKLEEQEFFIKQIADASPTILYLFDVPQNSFAYINREIFFVLGYSPEEMIAMGDTAVESLYHPEDIALLPERKGIDKHFQVPDSMIQYECRMKNKSGEWCWLLVREVAFKVEEGQVVQVLGTALDINRRKEMERSLLNNSFQLEQSNASLEEFAYVASHDLKEPLRKISTFGDRLLSTQMENLSDDGKMYLKKIVDASQRMQTMITDLLSISMISGNKSFEPYSLQTILEDVLQTLEFKIEQKNAVIHVDKLPVLHIVPSQFRQLFQNLLSNSLKFAHEGVQPVSKISYQYIKADEIKDFKLSNADFYHKIEFMDNGIGFENEHAGRIFAIFQRLHGRSEYEGTGIGLAICKKIVEHHGGAIYANGVPGKGATFTIILPA